ncbi:hypothetical protein [Fodinicurvata sp. EGI_FJ10296]|uniref:hypothetical protein n=1 Tax=Fodinicurvata sp. EGI_FJ10296 TaxID=3231908 RepID=UPI0034527B95
MTSTDHWSRHAPELLNRDGPEHRPEERQNRLDRAFGYPYPAPEHSYLFVDGNAQPLAAHFQADIERDGRIPVLAFGSNRAPAQLARKYQGWPTGTTIPVTRALITGWDVVYGSHIASYGSLPACLYPSPGTMATIAVNWLTPSQLDRMHETEGPHDYAFSSVEAVDLAIDALPTPETVYYYRPLHTPFMHEGAPVALSAVSARGRRWRESDQRGAQMLLRDVLAPDSTLEDFVWAGITDAEVRRDRTRRLRAKPIK